MDFLERERDHLIDDSASHRIRVRRMCCEWQNTVKNSAASDRASVCVPLIARIREGIDLS